MRRVVRDPKHIGGLMIGLRLGEHAILHHGEEQIIVSFARIKGSQIRLCFNGPKSFVVRRDIKVEDGNNEV